MSWCGDRCRRTWRLIDACAENPQIAPTLLMIEHLPELVTQQVKAIQNLKIDKIL